MFKLRLAEYINNGLHSRGLTYKEFSALSGVPTTTLHSYAQGRVNNPDDENLSRIAKAFGDDPNVIRDMRRASMDSTAQENRIIAQSDDKERMEQLAGLIRANMLEVMDAYKEHSTQQQDQIIKHADERVAQTEQRCEARVKAADEIWRERLATQKEHDAEVLTAEKQHRAELRERNEASRAYLKTLVRNLSLALAVLVCLAVGLGAYGVYAYNVFDRNDLTRGLIREDSNGITLLFVALVLCACAGFGVALFRLLHRKAPEARHAEKTE